MIKEIDLHGLAREDAFMIVEDELLRLSNLGSFQLDIITGNSKLMRDGVIEICRSYNFNYTTLPHNMGRINVTYVDI